MAILPTVLLVGAEAEGLAPRLMLSGYSPLSGGGPSGFGGAAADPGAEAPTPQAVILAPGTEAVIPALRRRFPGVPLLLGIGSDSVEGRVHCLSSGADDFWLTGLGPSDLLTRLRLHLGLQPLRGAQAREVPAPVLQVADLRLAPHSRDVQRAGRRISLTSREYELLLLLMQRSGHVVSRERILAAIWQEERPAASNVIEVYVRYLRQKLEEGGQRRLIHTVRGRGYCLAEQLPSTIP